ncbi:MAG: hypothetical protein HY458_00375 [Parcubacteria group bacterium]|nr:hypothetical protein [Parcubacteria group bacterium]
MHRCEALVIHCIDFRLRKALTAYLAPRFFEGYDLISVAGSVQALNSEGVERDFLLKQLQISSRLHSPKTILLIQHEDCGAYGGSRAFSSPEEERAAQRAELDKAETLLMKSFPQAIEKYFIPLSGKVISF